MCCHFQILKDRETLPVKKFEREILDAVYHNSVVIIRGATGCGKTTQVPQYILDDHLRNDIAAECNIVVTQVRNICVKTTWVHGGRYSPLRHAIIRTAH